MNRVMMLECVQEVDGFTLGKSYKCLGNAGKYVEMVNNLGNREIMLDIYFKGFSKQNKNKQ